MRQKLKPNYDPEAIQSELIETVCYGYQNGVSVRALAKKMELSPMKVRKILITGGVYSTDLSTEIGELWKDGKTVGEIAELLNMTTANVNAYLPYERIIYNMEERSVEADRQARYRERLKSRLASDSKQAGQDERDASVEEKPVYERIRTRTLIIVIGTKLRKLIPAGVLDETSDPLARDKSFTWGGYENGQFVMHEPPDPDKMIWCAEVTSAGRGKNKKSGIVLMSANCGFAVIAPFPPFPGLIDTDVIEDYVDRRAAEEENQKKLRAYRTELEKSMLESIKSGMLEFCLPEDRVLDYTDTVLRVELVKGKPSTPAVRLEELIERELKWNSGDDPLERFNVRGNWTSRKFGNGDYRRVDDAVARMLMMTEAEQEKWLERFLAPVREKLAAKPATEG